MRTPILLSAAFIACGATTPAAATTTDTAPTPKAADTCKAKYYTNLIGKDIGETQLVTSDYRLLPDGAVRSTERAKRLTFVYDARTKLIMDVACG